jgi:hypothetical protein
VWVSALRGKVGEAGGPGDWDLDLSRCACSRQVDAPSQYRAAAAATQVVWRLTCQRFSAEFDVAARWVGSRCDTTLHLSAGFAYPVSSVTAVRSINLDGAVETWAAGEWRLDLDGSLVKQHGTRGSTWPWQDPQRPVGHPGSWWVEATIGCHPPADVVRAAEDLACELLLADVDPENCSLPDNVRSITRQGTTIEFDKRQWDGVPLVAAIAEPAPKGWGCAAADRQVMVDPAAAGRWVEVLRASLPV